MSMIQAAIESLLNELNYVTNRSWKVDNTLDSGGKLIQPNNIKVEFSNNYELLSILVDTLEIIRNGDIKWCLE